MLDISELSRFSGCPASKLRYYEDIGLIRSVGRRGLKRLYDNDVKMRLSIISLAQSAQFSLTEIKQMIGTEGTPELDNAALIEKADAIDAKINELTVLSKGLRHIANCTADRHLECPRFQRIMRAALVKKGKKRAPRG